MIGVGEEFPHTTLNGVVGINPDKVIKQVYTDDEQGDWKVIFFYPKDFTFICPTEIAAFEKVAEQENCSVYGISPDNEYCHLEWLENNPLLEDVSLIDVAELPKFKVPVIVPPALGSNPKLVSNTLPISTKPVLVGCLIFNKDSPDDSLVVSMCI